MSRFDSLIDTSPDSVAAEAPTTAVDVDVLVVGAGITGIYQLYRARQAAFSARLLEAGTGVGAPGSGTASRAPGSTRRATPAATFSPALAAEAAAAANLVAMQSILGSRSYRK